jgi:DNA-binding response OmpR family regulator
MALLGWIRNNADFIDLPILVLVDASNEYALQRAFDRGANSFVVKRQNLGELVQTIKTLELFNHVNSVPREPVREVDSTVPSR